MGQESSASDGDRIFLHSLTRSAERVLSQTLGNTVEMGTAERLTPSGARSTVLRVPVAEGPSNAPASVIVKCARGSHDQPYDPGDLHPGGPSSRNIREWAGTLFLDRLDDDPPISVRFLGGDRSEGLIVLEDLGEGESLADHLLGEDTEKAEQALFAYARGMGRLHALTMGREAEYRELRRSLGDRPSGPESRIGNWLTEDAVRFSKALVMLGVTASAGYEEEIREIAALMESPGPFLAYAPGDTCPDNHRFTTDGIRFFDFEFSEFRHALLDGVYPIVPFPTCWCVNRLPEGMADRLLEAYRVELLQGCPEAGDETLFRRVSMAAHAFWLMNTVSGSLKNALAEDSEWGISTVRQRIHFRLGRFSDSDKGNVFPALGATARMMATQLNERWPELEPMPLYPAFKESDHSSPNKY